MRRRGHQKGVDNVAERLIHLISLFSDNQMTICEIMAGHYLHQRPGPVTWTSAPLPQPVDDKGPSVLADAFIPPESESPIVHLVHDVGRPTNQNIFKVMILISL